MTSTLKDYGLVRLKRVEDKMAELDDKFIENMNKILGENETQTNNLAEKIDNLIRNYALGISLRALNKSGLGSGRFTSELQELGTKKAYKEIFNKIYEKINKKYNLKK